MVQEEQYQRWCSNSSSGGGGSGSRSTKKLKQKKIPQRGLGVAQLEKIRLEEQQKKDAASVAVVPSSPCIVIPLPPHNPYHSQSSVPFPPPPVDLSSSSSLFRPVAPSIPISTHDLFVLPPPNPTPPPLHGLPSSPLGAEGGVFSALGDSAVTGAGDAYLQSIWNSHELSEGSKLDPGFTFRSRLQNDNTIWLPPVITHSKQPQQQHSSSSMVNAASVTSSSSGVNLQMEPPSNQSYYSNYIQLLWPEEKMVGIKRSWPFSVDNPSVPSFHYRYPSLGTPICRPEESSSCGNGGMLNYEQGNAIVRRGMTEINHKRGIQENGAQLEGDFLTLGLSATSSSSSMVSKSKQPLDFLGLHYRDLTEFDLFPIQGSIEQQPFYSFLPPKGQVGRAAPSTDDHSGEAGDSVDLNLKL
ncbi:PREDICTED: uncharacterized protein LOC104612101 [Nelumbo nucifera]|uniref:Uncharacterized protein LOC104612101 n=1 Tax=Nelumbo nucifera TaxID=4432 RepID=A0A1U8BKH6_NELNU|nr:PREDICTED: uncharacterized protein LOC104612101 [Nelumbo nucifera]